MKLEKRKKSVPGQQKIRGLPGLKWKKKEKTAKVEILENRLLGLRILNYKSNADGKKSNKNMEGMNVCDFFLFLNQKS